MTDIINSGIYFIINLVNGKIYVGSAVNFNNRWTAHIAALNRNYHKNRYLQSAWNKYGGENFEFKAVQGVLDLNSLLKIEQNWLDWTKCYDRTIGYNLYNIAGSPLGIKHTEERKRKASKRMTGFKHSEEAKLKMKGRKLTKEQCLKISLSKIGKPRSVETKSKCSTTKTLYVVWPHKLKSKCKCEECNLKRYYYNRSRQVVKLILGQINVKDYLGSETYSY